MQQSTLEEKEFSSSIEKRFVSSKDFDFPSTSLEREGILIPSLSLSGGGGGKKNTLLYTVDFQNITWLHRVTDNRWDFRDSSTEFMLTFYTHLVFSSTFKDYLDNSESLSSNIETVSTLKSCNASPLRFYLTNSQILFCSLRHIHLKMLRACFYYEFKRSNWQNTAQILLESVSNLATYYMFKVWPNQV